MRRGIVNLTNEQVLTVVNYDPGGCLCGHGESCWVCSRSDKAREFENLARLAARRLLIRRGVKLYKKPSDTYGGMTYYIAPKRLGHGLTCRICSRDGMYWCAKDVEKKTKCRICGRIRMCRVQDLNDGRRVKEEPKSQSPSVVMRRACLQEDEGRVSFVQSFNSEKAARGWIKKQKGYFSASDYFIAGKE